MRRALLPLVVLLPSVALAEEGMWLFNDFPTQRVRAAYGFAPTQSWLKRLRLASVRLARGCSGSFVSAQGLVLTNHHCARRCIQQLSTRAQNLARDGFLAHRTAQERACPEMEVNQLVGIQDVTDRIHRATRNQRGAAFHAARRGEMNQIEQECAREANVRCDVVTLYQGGAYHLYRYRRFQDVRLVFAPEGAIAHFGGDPDNFNFPRFALDFSLVRVYQGGRPARTPSYLRWNAAGAREDELVFVTGHPGQTDRLLTVAQLAFKRDVEIPTRLLYLAELRGVLSEFARRGAEERRLTRGLLLSLENTVKALRGEHRALVGPAFFARKVEAEKKLRARVAADARLRGTLDAWGAIARARRRFREHYPSWLLIEKGYGFFSKLFRLARTLVRAAAERAKPNRERLREFRKSAMPSLRQRLFSRAPLHPAVEELRLRFSFGKLREILGPDHPVVRRVLGRESPAELARHLVRSTRLGNLAFRHRLWEGGAAAVAASTDPMIQLAREVDRSARALRTRYQDQVVAVEKRQGDRIARARFALLGRTTYPDATFSLRLSYGAVQGWRERGRTIAPFTSLAGLFERATGRYPFALPPRWRAAKGRVDLATPLNFVSTNDIIGGNSGSPVVNSAGEVVGLVFDGNIHSLGGAFGFDPARNRAVSVHAAAILEALRKVYGATDLAAEIDPPRRAQPAGPPRLRSYSGRRTSPASAASPRSPVSATTPASPAG